MCTDKIESTSKTSSKTQCTNTTCAVFEKKMTEKNFTVGFTCGAFDILHTGHALMLEECKSVCDYLIVGLQTDPTIDRPNKNKPVQSLEERRVMLDAVRHVDEIMIYETEEELYCLLKSLKFHYPKFIRILGADWKGKEFTGQDLQIETFFNSRAHNYSSSSLRERIWKAESGKRTT